MSYTLKRPADISELNGKRIAVISGADIGSKLVTIACLDGTSYELKPVPDDNFRVLIREISYSANDPIDSATFLRGERIVWAEKVVDPITPRYNGRYLIEWHVYRLTYGDGKGSLTLYWLSESLDGYHSTVFLSEVTRYRVKEENKYE